MSDAAAFALKESLKDDFNGASVIVGPDSRLVNIGARLGDDGVIVTEDASEQVAFRAHPALKEVSVPAAKPATKGSAK